jgi:stage II sporulation protein E
VCRRCALRDACWQRDYVSTFNALNDALPAMVDRGRGQASDFPLHFTSRCLHFPQFLSAANEELTALLARRQYQARLQESRGRVPPVRRAGPCPGKVRRRSCPPSWSRPAREKKLRGHLTALGLEGNASVYYDEAGHLRAELEGPDLSALTEPKERKALSALLGLPLREPEYTGSGALDKVVFTQAEPLMAVAGVAARQKDGETVSGDAGAWFRTDAGLLYILLCDGMGRAGGQPGEQHGHPAAGAFLKAGVEAEAALAP